MTLAEAMAILGLEGSPTIEQVQDARRILLKVWHPDRFADDPVVHAEAERRTKLINQAWKTVERAYEINGRLVTAASVPPSKGGGEVDEAEPARRVGGWTTTPKPEPRIDRPGGRWPEGLVTAILCAGWLIPIVAGAAGVINATTAIGGFIVFVLVALAYLVINRFVR